MSNGSLPEITVAELPPGATLLDVREDDEWEAGHAPEATHLPMTTLAERLDEVPDGSPVYVICRTGGRSVRHTTGFGYLLAELHHLHRSHPGASW